jgi:hypothetical protein
MTHNLKALGLALIASFALSAMVASAAWAAEFSFRSDGTFTYITGEEKNGQFIVDGGVIKCGQTIYYGTQGGMKTGFLIVEPLYTNCSVGGLTVEIHPNGCAFSFLQDNNTGGGKFDAITSIGCPVGEEMTITFLMGATAKCVIHIPEQTLGTGAVFTNGVTGKGIKDYKADISLSGIKYQQTKGTGIGACNTGDETANGSFAGSPTFTGRDESKIEETHIWVE